MNLELPFLRPQRSFLHGIHPAERKEATAGLVIEHMPFVDEYVLPLTQHIGAPSRPSVRVGQEVQRGERIAEPGGFVSVALHSPVTGTVTAIELRSHPTGSLQPAIVVRADPYADQKLAERLAADAHPDALPDASVDLVTLVQEGGLVGLGGAAFPAHVKLKVPEGKRVHSVILNGCECEPYLTCDHRIMLERPGAVVRGLRLMLHVLGAERGYIGIERNKPDAIELLGKLCEDDPRLSVVDLVTKYPEGAEKMLIEAALGQRVPVGKLPLDLGVVVNNVATTAALADLYDAEQPLIDRVITVTGPGIRRPANVRVPLGTPLRALVEHCGGLKPETRKIVLGGPMMGVSLATLDAPALKGTSGLLALTDDVGSGEPEPCIRCGRCLEACPMFLNPSRLALLAEAERKDDLLAYHVGACFECASCSYVCPSHIPLVQLIRMGKAITRRKPKA